MEPALEILKNLIIKKKCNVERSYVTENIDTLLWKPLSEHGSQKLAACLSSYSKEQIVISSKDYSMMVSMIQLGILANIPGEQFRSYLAQEMKSFLQAAVDDWSLIKIFIEWHRKLFFLLKNENLNTRENVVFLLLAEYFKTRENDKKVLEDLFLKTYRNKENENKTRDIVECLFLSFMIRDLDVYKQVPSTLVSLQDHIVYSKSETVFFKSRSCVQFYDRFLYTHLQDLYEQKRKKKTQTKTIPSEFIRSVKKLWDKEFRLFESHLKLPMGMISKIEIVFLNNMITGYMDTFKEWLFASSDKKDKEFFETVQMFASLYLSQSRPECSMEYQKVLVEWFTKNVTTSSSSSSLEELVNMSLTINNNLPSHMRYLTLAFSDTNCMQDKIQEYIKVLDMFIRESKDIKSGTSPFSRFSFNDDIMAMFSYIKDKDIFLEEYRNQMAVRLLRDSVKMDNEKTVLGYIKNQMGPSFTMKLEKMLQDVTTTVSSDARILLYSSWPDFLNVNVNVNILSANNNSNLFSEIINEYKRRVSDFEEKHDGHRILTPIFTEGQVCLRFSQKMTTTTWIDITCNPIQAMVLALAFERDLSLKELCDTMTITAPSEQSIIKALIQPLLKIKLVLESDGEEKLYSFNKDFKSKLRSIHVPQIILKKTSRENIDTSRNEVINACIVRILKTRKRIEHDELVREVISFTSRLFVIQPRQIKQQINELIDREYLERESSSIYKYLA